MCTARHNDGILTMCVCVGHMSSTATSPIPATSSRGSEVQRSGSEPEGHRKKIQKKSHDQRQRDQGEAKDMLRD
jgi:hypothetical protein